MTGMKKRCLAFFLCICILVTMLIPVAPVKAREDSAFVVYNEEIIDNISISETEKKTVSAVFDGEAVSYQWQILADSENEIWANIFDKTAAECEISYALVKNMLDSLGTAFLRCKITCAEGEAFTNHLSVSVFEEEPETVTKNAEEMILVSGVQVVEPVEEPAEEEISEETFEKTASEETLEEDFSEEVTEEEILEEDISEEIIEEEIIEEEIPEEDVSKEETEEIFEENISEEVFSEETVFSEAYSEEASVLLADGDKDLVTITIKHLDYKSYKDLGEEKEVMGPYIATIERGTAFHQTIIPPTFIGYAPFYDGDKTDQENDGDYFDDDATVLELNYPSVNDNIVINVFYKPSKVDYAIKYFFQNTNDDLYTEDPSRYFTGKAETGTIISEDEIAGHAGSTVGFSKIYHIPEAVAADGSTVFECYYDRNYYLIKFDLDGGFGVDPIYARYGTLFVVNDPVKPGYVFGGWDLLTEDTNGDGKNDKGDGVKDDLPKSILAEESVYKAIWGIADTTYTVVYWKENADDDGYSYWGSIQIDAISTTLVSGKDDIPVSITTKVIEGEDVNERVYFSYNENLTDKDVVVEGDGSTVVNVYYTRNVYSIVFRGSLTIKDDVPKHVHSAACEGTICGMEEHVHISGCGFNCVEIEHTHALSCYTCGKTMHVHSSECCTLEEHSHNTACWNNVGDVDTNNGGEPYYAPDNPSEGYVYVLSIYNATYRYIYINNTWYRYYGNTSNGTVLSPNCGKNEHTHGDGCIYCNLEEHEHGTECATANCPNGGKEHEHSAACYDCGKIAHVHSSACYCNKPQTGTSNFPLGSSNGNNGNVRVYYITAKYEQTIGDVWPTSAYFDNTDFYGWSIDGTGNTTSVSKRVNMTKELCDTRDGIVYANVVENSDTDPLKLYYMFESFEQSPGGNRKLYEGKYYEKDDIYSQDVNSDSNTFNQKEIMGMTPVSGGSKYSESENINYLYYTRNRYTLKFQNISETVKTIGNVMYGQPFKEYKNGTALLRDYEPTYPPTLEPNAYYFDGWYTSPGCYTGSEVNWDSFTMPNDNLTLYAKWSPKVHTVKFFKSYDEMLTYEGSAVKDETLVHQKVENISHGEVVNTAIEDPERYDDHGNKLVFAGWFFMENGVKKRFTPLEYPIKKDMHIFADWSTFSPQPYRISYVLESDNSVHVADDSVGYAYAGSTRTFTAKAGYPSNQLYDLSANGGINYNIGYFPTIASHSITIQYEEDNKVAAKNVHVFEYVKAEHIQYKVQYINKETGAIMDEEIKSTENAVVTERFRVYTDMIPDAFYKRLVISVEQDSEGNWVGTEDNIIQFYYTPNKTSAYYAVHFMLEKLGASDEDRANYDIHGNGGYEESTTHIEGIGNVGSKASVEPLVFDGFTIIPEAGKEVVESTSKNAAYTDGKYEITVTSTGTELYIFYSRNEYEYNVYYYIYNTTDSVPFEGDFYPHENGVAKYGSSFDRTAPEIPNYTCVSQNKTQTLLIRDNVDQNVLVFYYSPIQYTVEYVAVPPEGGWLSSTLEVANGMDDFEGSLPTANANYRFDGWYIDLDCTTKVDAGIGMVYPDNRFIPIKDNLSETDRNIFYAKFTPLAGKLTITRNNSCDDDQVYVYEVKNKDTEDIITVTIVGNGSVTINDLIFGDYIITQKNIWSWRNDDAAQEIRHENVDGTGVVFEDNEREKLYWLNGNSEKEVNEKA